MAHANNISRSLIEISKTQGWDPTRIWDQEKGAYASDSQEEWHQAREPFDKGLGGVPGGVPPVSGDNDPSNGPVLTEKITFNYPDLSRESRENGNPKMTLTDTDRTLCSPPPGDGK